MIRVEPVQVQVRADWFDGRPREITWNSQRVPVTEVLGVREEISAYPVVIGPRTIFEVETPVARLTLSYRHRARRWAIEGMDQHRLSGALSSARPSLRVPRPRSRTSSALARMLSRALA